MARGSSKSDFDPVYSSPFRSKTLDAIRVASEDPAKLGMLRNFFKAAEKYAGNHHYAYTGHKERKNAVIEAFLAMPPELKLMFAQPKSDIGLLFRGADHPANPGADGKSSASFTFNKGTAKSFASEIMTMERPNSYKYKAHGIGVYSAKDIESFDGIFSLEKLAKLRRADGDLFEKIKGEKSDPDSLNAGEFESMVYGIKWKAGVGQPGWKGHDFNAL
jgi:hypothetical protein